MRKHEQGLTDKVDLEEILGEILAEMDIQGNCKSSIERIRSSRRLLRLRKKALLLAWNVNHPDRRRESGLWKEFSEGDYRYWICLIPGCSGKHRHPKGMDTLKDSRDCYRRELVDMHNHVKDQDTFVDTLKRIYYG